MDGWMDGANASSVKTDCVFHIKMAMHFRLLGLFFHIKMAMHFRLLGGSINSGEEFGWKNPMAKTQARIAERGVTLNQWRSVSCIRFQQFKSDISLQQQI